MENFSHLLDKLDEQDFMGHNFIWWYGVVEDRKDPLYLGRVKVRCIGFHTDDKEDIPTEDLPWAQVIQPITSAAISGIGITPTGPVEGTHVFGFFRDGKQGQEPVVIGTCGGIPITIANPERGFFDPRTLEQRKNSPYPPLFIERFKNGTPAQIIDHNKFPERTGNTYVFTGQNSYADNEYKLTYEIDDDNQKVLAKFSKLNLNNEEDEDASYFQIFSPNPDENRMFYDNGGQSLIFTLPSTNFLATGKIKLPEKPDEATFDPYAQYTVNTHRITENLRSSSKSIHSSILSASGSEFGIPLTSFESEYPFNHVTYSESGHLFEMNDTPQNEKIRLMHRSTSYLEFDVLGNNIENIVSEKHLYVDSNFKSQILGNYDQVIGGSYNLFMNSRGGHDSNIKIGKGGDLNVVSESGNIRLEAKGGGKIILKGSEVEIINKKTNSTENRDLTISGSNFKIDDATSTEIKSKSFAFNGSNDFKVDTNAVEVNTQGTLNLASSKDTLMKSTLSSTEVVEGLPLTTSKKIQTVTGNIQIQATNALTDGIELFCGTDTIRATSMTYDRKGFDLKSLAGDFNLLLPAGSFNSKSLGGVSFDDADSILLRSLTGKIKIEKDGINIQVGVVSLKKVFDELITAIGNLTVPTGVGPSGIPINKPEFEALKTKIGTLLK